MGAFVALGFASLAAACSSGSNDVVAPRGTGGSAGAGTGGGTAHPDSGAGGSQTGGGGGGAGQAGTGGAPSDAASGDSAGGDTILFAFASTVEGFKFNTYGTTADADLPNVLSDKMTISADTAVGDPSPGSLKVVIPFTAYDQQAELLSTFDDTALKNLAGKTLFAKVRLDSGFSPDVSAKGGLVFYVETTTTWIYGQAPWQNVDPTINDWVDYTFDLSAPDAPNTKTGFDPAKVKAIGFRFDTGGGVGATAKPTEATFHIDTIGYR
jgi:hypothetical protein